MVVQESTRSKRKTTYKNAEKKEPLDDTENTVNDNKNTKDIDNETIAGTLSFKKAIVEESKSPDIKTNKKDKLVEDDTMDTTSAKIIRYIGAFVDPVNVLVNKVSSVQSTDSSRTSSGRISRKPQNFNTNIHEKKKCVLRIRTFLKNPSPRLILLPIVIFRIFPLQK